MKPHDIYDTDAAKRAVNLNANSSLVGRAQEAGISLSKVFEDALVDKLRETLQKLWLEENRQAISAYNRRIEQHGVFGAGKRRF